MKQQFSMKNIILASCIALSVPMLGLAAKAIASPTGDADYGCHEKDQRMHGEMHGNQRNEMMSGIPPHLKQLNLTEAQQDQVFKIMYDQIPAMREQHKASRNIAEELHKLSQSDRFDDTKAQQLTEQLAEMSKEKALNRTRTEAKIFALLTPEQRQKVRDSESRHKDARHGMGEEMRGHMEPTSFRTGATTKFM